MIELLLKNRRIILGIIVVISLFLGWGISYLEVSFSFEDFYPKEDPEFLYYQKFQERFSEDQNYMVYIALKSPKSDIFDAKFLSEADSLFQQLGKLDGIDSFLTATNFSYLERKPLSFAEKPWLDWSTQENLLASKERIAQDSSMLGIFASSDLEYVFAYYFIEEEIFDSPKRDELSVLFDQKLAETDFEHIISGIPYIRSQYVAKIGFELLLFTSLAFVLIVIVQYFTYKNWLGIFIPQLAVIAGLVWVLGFMGWTGQNINLINNLLIPIIFVVGMSDVIHLNTQYFAQIRSGKSRWDSMKNTLAEIGVAILLTSITTAIGFASLFVSKVPPIRDFGLYAAAGVLFTFIVSVVILPNLMLGADPKQFLNGNSLENGKAWNTFFQKIYEYTLRKSMLILAVFAFLILSSILLISQISLDTYLIEDIGKNDPVRVSMEFFEDKTYGLRPFEMGFEAKDSMRFTDREALLEMEKIENFLKTQAKFSPFLSPVSFVKEAHYINRFNRASYRKIPEKQKDIDRYVGMAKARGGGELLEKVMSPDARHARISSRTADLGTYHFEELAQRLDDFISSETDTSLFSYKLTGHAHLTENNLNYIRSSLMGGLGIAFAVIGLIMGLLFRSWKMLFISMIPNVLPLIFTGGLMGLFGITLTASTALVFVVAFGIAVDDTIHFLSRFRLERSQGQDLETAIQNTLQGTGKAIIITSFILTAGFILMLFSNFGGTFNTGLFTALTILFAVLSDLFLLPILLRWIH